MFQFVSVSYETDLFVSVVSIKILKTETNRNIYFLVSQNLFFVCFEDTLVAYKVRCRWVFIVSDSNGNASETKANESFDNGVFFDSEAKRTPSIVSKLFSKRSEHIR